MLINRELGGDSSESSSSGIEDEAEDLDFGQIRRWQEDVSIQAISDYGD